MMMKATKWLSVLLIVVILAAGCREFTVAQTHTPAQLQTNANIPAALTTTQPQPVGTQDPLTIRADEVDQLLANIYARTNPGVVNIDILSGSGADVTDIGLASGFVIDKEGHIITNNHVVADATELEVTFADGSVATAGVVGADPYSDLAVIKVDVDPARLTPLPLGDSDQMKVGQRVVAIGNPFGFAGTMTVGIISAKGRALAADTTNTGGIFNNPDIIQTDAAINPGNSGGPLLNSQGQVVGVNAEIRTNGTRANSGVGFAVPSNTVKRVTQQILKDGRVSYPYLGVSVDNHFSTAQLAAALKLPVTKGVIIAAVIDGGPAERADLRGGNQQVTVRGIPVRSGGDIITAIDGDPINSFDEMIAYLAAKKQVGQTVTVTILRGTDTLQVPVTLDERPR
jgi:2-alkenal reductase